VKGVAERYGVSTSPMVPIPMYIDDLFRAPVDRVAAFARAQVHLYRHDVSLQDYFMALQTDTLTKPRLTSSDLHATNGLIKSTIQSFGRVGRLRARRKIKAEVLFCPVPYFARKAENEFFVRALLGLAQTDAKILCLLPTDAPCRNEMDDRLAAAGRSSQVEFLDPTASLNSMDARLLSMASRARSRSALRQTVQILEPYGLSPSAEVKANFDHAAHFVEAWERLAPWVEFDAVVARCHWNVLCSPVCRSAQQQGKPVITFQQGVIGHTLDVPVSASKYVAFGQTSASLMAELNARFFQAAGMPVPHVDFVTGGCIFDTVVDLPGQFDRQTLLMVDVHVPTIDFYGIESQVQALLQLARKLLAADLPLRRLIIRPHPYWSDLDLESCKRLIREYPERCELSHPSWSLEDDLRRSSIVAGIFSGVLTVASACGMPSVFLQTERGFVTADLACFSQGQTFQPDAAFSEISKILTDEKAYANARSNALRNAREYYADGANLDLSGAFFESLLQAELVKNRPTRKPL
jgi:hypothetical protein